MQKLLFIFILSLAAAGCTKRSPSPEGPTDIRVVNLTSSDFTDVYVKTDDDDEHIFGDLPAGDTTEYFRFKKAFPEAEVRCKINGVDYTTGIPDNTYAVYLGQGKFSYKVWVLNDTQRKLAVDVRPEAPLK